MMWKLTCLDYNRSGWARHQQNKERAGQEGRFFEFKFKRLVFLLLQQPVGACVITQIVDKVFNPGLDERDSSCIFKAPICSTGFALLNWNNFVVVLLAVISQCLVEDITTVLFKAPVLCTKFFIQYQHLMSSKIDLIDCTLYIVYCLSAFPL